MTIKLNQSVGLRLKAARKAVGFTQEQLAEKIDRTKEAISNLERGNNLPTIETLDRLCSILGIKIQDVFKDSKGSSRRVEAIADIDLMLDKMSDDDVMSVRNIITTLSVWRS